MSLGVVRGQTEATIEYSVGARNGHEIFGPWKNWEPSRISHHGTFCCEIVREWLGHTDFSVLNGGKLQSGPRWLRQRFDWGPSTYPVHWCEVLKKKVLDCGIHAALAHEVFTHRGLKSYRAQLVQEFSSSASSQWQLNWEKNEAITEWIGDELIYHEGCALVVCEDQVKLWDSSAGWWMDPRTTSGYGSLRAVKISAGDGAPDLSWGRHVLRPNEWTVFR